MTSPTFGDYLNYFLTGFKLEGMNQTVLALLRGLHYVIIAALSIIVFNVYDAIVKGTFAFTWEAWQQYLIPAVIFILGFLNEMLRKGLNPSVSIKTLPTGPVVESVSPTAITEQNIKPVPPLQKDEVPPAQ